MYYSLRYYKEETKLVVLFFRKGVVEELVVKILDIYNYKEFQKFFCKTEIVNLRISAKNN